MFCVEYRGTRRWTTTTSKASPSRRRRRPAWALAVAPEEKRGFRGGFGHLIRSGATYLHFGHEGGFFGGCRPGAVHGAVVIGAGRRPAAGGAMLGLGAPGDACGRGYGQSQPGQGGALLYRIRSLMRLDFLGRCRAGVGRPPVRPTIPTTITHLVVWRLGCTSDVFRNYVQ